MKRMLVPVAAAALCVAITMVSQYPKGQMASNAAQAAPVATARPLPKQPTAFGINPYIPAYWSGERVFMNLAAGGAWNLIKGGWSGLDPKRLNRDDTLLGLYPGEAVALSLNKPAAAYRADTAIRCRYQGNGMIGGVGVANAAFKPGQLDFTWPKDLETAHVRIDQTDPANPVRQIDCREANADPKALFDPKYIEFLRPFKVVRFMDWQQTNPNVVRHWADRTLPSATSQAGLQGVAVEHLVALANQAGVDPWFTIPWNADANYITSFARYVHDNLDPKRTIYVEMGNEVWNFGFAAATQALDEGQKLRLGGNKDELRMRRYAQRSVEGFKIWEAVFADNPKRIVRVLAGQLVWPDLFKMAIDYGDTAQHVDAISAAMYFGHNIFDDAPANMTDLAPAFVRLDAAMNDSFNAAKIFKQIADSRGKRFIAYEGGQHVTYRGPDKTLIPRLNRDPRMADVYRRFLTRWDREYGDALVLYSSVSRMGPEIHFGLMEYSGQPVSETPKHRALLEVTGVPAPR